MPRRPVSSPEIPDLPEPPDVFSYVDYRAWLTAALDAALAHHPAWTHRTLSAACGFRSSGALALVTGGHRRLSEASARRVGAALGLRAAECEHLALCVRFEQADSPAAKAQVLHRMKGQRRFVQVWAGTLQTLAFYETWYLPILRELVSLVGSSADASALAQRLRPLLSLGDIEKGLAQLEQLGFLAPHADGGWELTDSILATTDEVASQALLLHHEHMLQQAAQALREVPATERNFRVATVAISHAQAARVHAMLHQFVRDVMNVVVEDEPMETIYQLNLQWFPWTRSTDRSEWASPAEIEQTTDVSVEDK
jgi:uncharacterized protein (TIGR02147 family)